MSTNETLSAMGLQVQVQIEEEEKNLISPGVRIFGLFLMAIVILLALYLIGWVLWNRRSRVVAMMQPVFLVMLCVGIIIQMLGIMPLGADDENTENVDAACISYWWLIVMGGTITEAALFSKLWRVNSIFQAQGFQRKVVTAKDVMRPFLVLFTMNLTILLVFTFVDPPVWHREPVDAMNESNTVGSCDPSGLVGFFMLLLIAVTGIAALGFLCVQAYRARDIGSEFSEARGVALALFSSLQAIIITLPVEGLIHKDNVDAKYMLGVMQWFVSGLSGLLFIFCPIIAHHRQYLREGSGSGTRTRISGLDLDTNQTSGVATATSVCTPAITSATEPSSTNHDEEYQATITSLEMEVDALRSQVSKLEADKSQESP